MARSKKAGAPSALADALAAIHRQDLGVARDALVEVWRGRRSPVLAELVDLLDRRAPDALSAQLAAIVTPRVITSHAALKQLAIVDDPRLATFALDALVNLPFTAVTAKDFLLALVATVARHRDPRVATRADAIRAAVTTRVGRLAIRTAIVKGVDRAIAKLPRLAAPNREEAALETALLAAVDPLRSTARSAATLLEDIYAHPDDDAPRLVYADLLLEQGDPRGELITLQIERANQVPIPDPGEREQELLKKHGKAWLGTLAPVLSWGKGYAKTAFRRGFVAKADIILSVGKKLRPIVTDPAWATVEEIDGLYRDDECLLELAPLRALRMLVVDADRVRALARRTELLAAVREVTLHEPIDAALLRAVFPNLVTVRSYAQSPRVESIIEYAACGTEHVDLKMWRVDTGITAARDAFDAFVDGLVGTPAHVARLTLAPPYTRPPAPPEIELRRDPAGNYERVSDA